MELEHEVATTQVVEDSEYLNNVDSVDQKIVGKE
jgi:hypothetical protein